MLTVGVEISQMGQVKGRGSSHKMAHEFLFDIPLLPHLAEIRKLGSQIDQPSFSVLCGGHKAIIHSHRAPSPTHGTGHQRCGHSQPHPLGEAPGARAAAEAVFP